jgi:beta-galactosidase/beta-glucuronidase
VTTEEIVMKYYLDKSNYSDFDTIEKNKLPGRSYFIPYPSREGADRVSLKEKRYQSEKVKCLNGDWDFRFYPRPAELPDVLDTDNVKFDTIDVPSCWQFRGYYHPFYVNIRYQFPYHPPVIPREEKVGKVFSIMGVDQKLSLRYKDPGEEYNFVGVYRKKIEIEDDDKNYVISFLGVASCLDLYVNGSFVGYSEGAHNTAEFDLTGYLEKGENELVAVVHRWCTGTYLECQDMFRNNGIFRDVLLRISEPSDFWDLDAVTKKNAGKYSLKLSAKTLSDTDVTFILEGNGITRRETVRTNEKSAAVTFEDLDVTEWSAEDPVLYNVYFETSTSCVKERIGFKSVKIHKDVFYLNGHKIKFKGVNHHDTSPTDGYTLTPDEIERDVRLCREFNIDTIRTSHYPPDPLLLEMADEMGVYIVDENDLETHGTVVMQLPSTYNSISDDPKWEPRYVDRIQRLYQRDKLHANTSIIMWSLGNEAGGYHNTDAMYDYLRAQSDIPVHYESAVHCKRQAYDVGSEMYPSVDMVHRTGEHRRKMKRLNDRPYFMCEYAHAMGVGPGNTEAYWKEIYNYDNLMGGCVWEMVDHAILHEDGSYTYGGDHGEWEHDGNFCVDGMFYPDRTPSVGAKIIRFIYRPIRVTYVEGDIFEFFNTTAFSEGRRYHLNFLWNDGTETNMRVKVAPLTRIKSRVPLGSTVDGNLSAIVTVVDTKTGETVSEEQIVISEKVPEAPVTKHITEDCVVANGTFALSLPGGRTLISAEQSTLLYRAATDNDTDLKFRNSMLPYFAQTETVKSSERTPNGYKVVTEVTNEKASFLVTDMYEGTSEGILVTSTLHCTKGGGIVPRFGKCFRLDDIFDQVKYIGRTGESYCDMKEQFPIREVSCTVADMTEPNIRPQESGNRCDCTLASVSDGRTTVTFKAVDKPFELAIKPYTDKALFTMRHRSDEIRTGTYVTIQAFQQGIGTGACGPGVMPEYQYSAKEDYELRFIISFTEKK